MHNVTETLRLPSPAPRPQALAFDGEKLWMGSIETNRLYAIDPRQWTLIEEENVPGKPWGMTVVGDELRVVCGIGENDDRVIRRFVPGTVSSPRAPSIVPTRPDRSSATTARVSTSVSGTTAGSWGSTSGAMWYARSTYRMKSADSATWTGVFTS